jgi:hypothetical protein
LQGSEKPGSLTNSTCAFFPLYRHISSEILVEINHTDALLDGTSYLVGEAMERTEESAFERSIRSLARIFLSLAVNVMKTTYI